jgi:3-hydroxypropanoate dehydrogenase
MQTAAESAISHMQLNLDHQRLGNPHMPSRLPAEAIDQLFMAARSHTKWQPRDVPDSLLRDLVDIMKMAPTSANCSPARLVFVKSAAAKGVLKPYLSQTNMIQTMAAPVTVIVGYDRQFYDHLPKLYPYASNAKSWFTSSEQLAELTAFRNGTLQGGYLLLAARALGLDVGAMSGFDNAGIDSTFFARTSFKSNFLMNIGYGDQAGILPRSPRFEFDDMAQII